MMVFLLVTDVSVFVLSELHLWLTKRIVAFEAHFKLIEGV